MRQTNKTIDKAFESERHKPLDEYSRKRNFTKTSEPPGLKMEGGESAFVIHRHHATRLHYDLRLEQDGVLKSWAVPKGLPPRPGIMRLAVSTEDHPIEYINFEGTIPKGEYGAGEVWVFAGGRYELTSEKKKGFHFRLQSREIAAEYRMHRTGDKEWLLGRVDTPQVDWLRDPVEPMLAQSADAMPEGNNYLYEVKWDGIRALIALDEGTIRIHSRNRQDMTDRFPELLIPDRAFRAASALFDAEIVCLDNTGRPVFTNVVRRMQQTERVAIDRLSRKYPAVCYVFDCLYLDGRPIVNDPLVRRRAWMEDAIRNGTPYRISEAFNDGAGLFEAGKKIGLEGVMAKEMNSIYLPGRRIAGWLKIKHRHTLECIIVGYTAGKGSRMDQFGSLQLAVRDGKRLRYAGKVGAGFDDILMKRIFSKLKSLKQLSRPFKEKPPDDAATTWIEPKIVCEVQYASVTEDGLLREPVFLRLRPDLEA
jgi:bifunctional non-homologous end joining protein LigD